MTDRAVTPTLPVDPSNDTETDDETIALKKKRARRVSFVDNEITSVHIFNRDDEDSETPPGSDNPSSSSVKPPGEAVIFKCFSDLVGNSDEESSPPRQCSQEDYDEVGVVGDGRRLFIRPTGSPTGSSAVSVDNDGRMKTVKAIPGSSKPITLSKAAKILSWFVSVENGASPATSVYLQRASTALNELNQLHKDIRNPVSVRKHKQNKSDNVDCEKDVVENKSIKFGDKQGKHKKLIKEEENQDHGVSRSFKGHNPALETNMVIEDGIENHTEKKKKRKQDFEAKNSGGYGNDMREQDELKPALSDKLNQEPDHKVDNDLVRECAEEKHKKDRRKKKKDKASKDIMNASEVQNIRVKDEMVIEDVNEKGKKHDKGVEKTVKTDGVEREEKKKRKKDGVEDRQEDGSRELHSKKRRRNKTEDDK